MNITSLNRADDHLFQFQAMNKLEGLMLGRWLGFGIVFALFGLPIGYMIIHSKDQLPWLIALASYGVVGGLIGNWYVFFGDDDADFKKVFGWLALNGAIAGIIAVGYMVIVHRI